MHAFKEAGAPNAPPESNLSLTISRISTEVSHHFPRLFESGFTDSWVSRTKFPTSTANPSPWSVKSQSSLTEFPAYTAVQTCLLPITPRLHPELQAHAGILEPWKRSANATLKRK